MRNARVDSESSVHVGFGGVDGVAYYVDCRSSS